MESGLTITSIHTVFEGEFNPGQLRNHGRRCDAFVYYYYGEADYCFAHNTMHVGDQGMFYLAKGSDYTINVHKRTKFICIDFDFNKGEISPGGCLFKDISPTVSHDFSNFFHLWLQKSPYGLPKAYSILYRIYYEALKAEHKQYAKRNQTFATITAYILEHYTDPALSVADMAAHAGISEVHLRRLFQAGGNGTPIAYLHWVRLEKAKNMLRSSNYSIAEIAQAVGYEDPYYFSRLFREKIGSTPSQYRKENKA